MEWAFPLQVDHDEARGPSFFTWTNDFNPDMGLRFVIGLPSFLSLHRADIILPTSRVPVADLGYFKSADKQVEIIIQASALQHEVSLRDYYDLFERRANEAVLARRTTGSDMERTDHLVARRFDDGELWITRRRGLKVCADSGVYVVTVNCACHEGSYGELAELFLCIMESFELLRPSTCEVAEELCLFSKGFPVDFSTYIPGSWLEGKQEYQMRREMVTVLSKRLRGREIGALKLHAVAPPVQGACRADLIRRHLSSLSKAGLNHDRLSFTPVERQGECLPMERCSHDFVLDQEDGPTELHVEIYTVRHSQQWLIMSVLGPSRDVDFEAWAINKRALDLVVEHLVLDK